jgi:NAD(P)-dependent dehydrogenase (short-subunit alcohol dehydrogenase family)
MAETVPIVVVTGVGPGTGAAIARRFSRGGYKVAMLALTPERLAALEREIQNATDYAEGVLTAGARARTCQRRGQDQDSEFRHCRSHACQQCDQTDALSFAALMRSVIRGPW